MMTRHTARKRYAKNPVDAVSFRDIALPRQPRDWFNRRNLSGLLLDQIEADPVDSPRIPWLPSSTPSSRRETYLGTRDGNPSAPSCGLGPAVRRYRTAKSSSMGKTLGSINSSWNANAATRAQSPNRVKHIVPKVLPRLLVDRVLHVLQHDCESIGKDALAHVRMSTAGGVARRLRTSLPNACEVGRRGRLVMQGHATVKILNVYVTWELRVFCATQDSRLCPA
jgi:hypothetical protein